MTQTVERQIALYVLAAGRILDGILVPFRTASPFAFRTKENNVISEFEIDIEASATCLKR